MVLKFAAKKMTLLFFLQFLSHTKRTHFLFLHTKYVNKTTITLIMREYIYPNHLVFH